ncbi:MAG: hypothetical protein ACK4Q5_19375, partial [Saprospiraceae bacterium]
MENSKKIQLGLLAVVAALLVANLFGGGFKNWFGQSEGDKIRTAAASNMTPDQYSTTSGNIPGTNIANSTPAPVGPTTTIKYEEEAFDFGV